MITVISYFPCSLWAASTHPVMAERNYFHFAIPEYHTARQSGQTVNIHVKYAYKAGLPSAEYPDYRILRSRILKYMEPSDEFPADVYWEILAAQMGKELMNDFPLEGISIQLTVLDNPNPDSYEPGDHGPVYTAGNIEPLDVHP